MEHIKKEYEGKKLTEFFGDYLVEGGGYIHNDYRYMKLVIPLNTKKCWLKRVINKILNY
jgi:hypothetical protein